MKRYSQRCRGACHSHWVFSLSYFLLWLTASSDRHADTPLGTSHTKSAVPAETQDMVLEVLRVLRGISLEGPRHPGSANDPFPAQGCKDSSQSTVCKARPPSFCQRSLYVPSVSVVPPHFDGLQEGFQLPESRTQSSFTCKRLH